MGTFEVPPSPTPSVRNASWHDGADTLKRSLSMFNRPLPETPKASNTPSESSRCGTPKSLFDNIQKPPSVVLEKIKNKANATLDRMQMLQQRYRQQKDQMERDRSGSALDQNVRAFDQWSSISPSPSHFRSGSMSSGINSSQLDLTDDSSFNLFHQRQMARQHHQMAAQRANQLGQRGMSSSVFNLNQMHRKPPVTSNGWMNNSMQQAQSVAQLNCANCNHPPQRTWGGQQQQHAHVHQHDPWSNQLNSQQHLNRSNLSLNIGPGYMIQHPHNGMYPPPVFMNQHPAMGQMYPQPYMGGMPVMNPGLAGVPPPVSRTASRAGSRMASPAMSRKSVTLRRKQHTHYREDEGTDDEDSDDDDRRSIVSNRSGVSRTRQRRISSASQFQVDEDLDAAAAKLQRSRVRSQRRDSIAKSVHNDWAPGRKASAGNNRSVDSGFNSPLKPSRIYSDLDSEGSGTRALVQAKIEQKLKEENLKQEKQTKTKKRSVSPPKHKQSAAVQTPLVQAKKEKGELKPTTANESEEEYEIDEEEVTDEGSEEEEAETVKEPEPQTAIQTANGLTTDQLDVPAEDEDAVSLGPPPSTPDQEWECEFCTFVNEPNIKICIICCKTPSKPPKLLRKSGSPPKQVKASATVKEQSGTFEKIARIENDTRSLTDKTQSSLKENASLSTDDINDTITITSTSPTPSKPTASFNKKESVDDIWATLDEDIQATAHEVTRKAESSRKPTKVSTGCGTSSKSVSLERQEVELQTSQAREIGISPPPQMIFAQPNNTLSVKKSVARDEPPQLPSIKPSQPLGNDVMQESDLYKHTTEELNAALKYCGPDTHPLVWLRDNWPKLIQTVQSLATKYGQERAENTIGTISQMEAREALRIHTGNIWQAVSECIEQRQRKYREISSKGNFSREDVVTALTTHQGNVDLALLDLGRTQLKPFLMRIWGSPGGVENESGAMIIPPSSQSSLTTPFTMDKDIHNFLSANASDCMQIPIATGAFTPTNQMPSPFDLPASLVHPYDITNTMPDNTSSYSADSKDYAPSPLPVDDSILNNKSMLKDLESLIGTMEQNQQKQNEQVLRSIHNMISNMKQDKPDDEYDPEMMRILTKSPITSPKLKNSSNDKNSENDADVKSFVWQHIQEIVPNLVQQVEMELREDKLEISPTNQEETVVEPAAEPTKELPPPPPPIDQDEFLMEEVIKPNLKNASIREELPPNYVYAAEIATFQMAFDKGLERLHKAEFQFDCLKEAGKQVFKMYKAPDAPKPATPSETENKSQATLENIPATVCALSTTPEPPKHSPSPIIPLTIDDVLGQTTIDEHTQNDQTLIPPELPPFEDILSVGDALPVEATYTNTLNIASLSEHPELLPTENLGITPSPKADANTDMMTPQDAAIGCSKLGVALEPQTLTLNEVATASQSLEPNELLTLGSTTDNFEIPHSVEADDSILTFTEEPGFVQPQSYEFTNIGSESLPQQTLHKYASKPSINSISSISVPESTNRKSKLPNMQTHDPVMQTEVVSNQAQVIEFDSPNEIIETSAGSTDFVSLATVSDSTITSDDNIVSQVSDLTPEPAITSTDLPSTSQPTVQSYEADITQPTINITLTSNQKKISKIPVRRTASKKSLISSPVMRESKTGHREEPGQQTPTPFNVLETFSTTYNRTNRPTENDSEEEELYSLASETFTDFDSRTDDVQSPTSTNEVFLMIHQDGGESTIDESTILPSTSSSTVHSATSFSSGLKSPTEFVPSGDPSKQNLSELVMDTQRLIKQMKEEINMEDFESSTDDDFTDDYSDEYDDDDDDDDEEDLEEEEDDDGDWDNENPDVMDDLTEEDEMDENQLNTVNSAESLDTQEHRDEHNTSVSSKHSQSLSSVHNVIDEVISIDISQPQITSNPHEESMIYVESENQIPELPVETLATTLAIQEQSNRILDTQSMSFVESENSLPEMQVDMVLVESPEDTTSTSVSVSVSAVDTNEEQIPIILTSVPLSLHNDVETENSLPELPVETVLLPVTEILPLQTENIFPELPTEVVVTLNEPATKSIQSSIDNEKPHTSDYPQPYASSSINIIKNIPSTSGNSSSSTEPTLKVTKELTSIAKTSEPKKINSLEDDNKPSTSKGAKAKTTTDTKQISSDATKVSNKKPVTASKIPKPKETIKEQKPKEVAAVKVPKSKVTPAPQEEKPKESPNSKVYNDPKRKMPMRSKSFSGPPIGISSVKTITQKFLNQTKPQTNTAQTPKAPISVSRKPSITEAINKLTKPSTSIELPSTSSLFRTRAQPRLPKKKYHETCFSDDDYGSTTSEEEPETLEIRQRKLSIPVFRAYPIVQEPEEVKTEELVDKFMKEELVKTVAEAQIAATLVSMKFQQDASLWAAKECSDLDHAIALLKQECELCSGTYALNQIVSMLKCTHNCCKQCAKAYFTVQITERSINDCNCPFCKQPELTNPNEHEDENLEYFSNLDIYLKNIVEPEVHELFQRKLRDRSLLKDPNFKWCVQCSSGFFARPKQKRLICPDCGSVTCALCRKTWQKQHEGISCEKFLEWEMGNDPEIQALGVQQHLEINGIDCPKCKFKYSLSRGGCMHFTCTQCKYEFCYGCARPFMMGAKCTISPYCAKLGLHAHHPRNCLFYLRDKLPVQLQILLKNNAVSFEVDPIESVNNDESGTSQKQPLRCPIPIQKETPTGLLDTKCSGDVPDKHAGMCRTHYVEYLTAKVAKSNIDPLPIFDLTDCVQELRRRGIPLPERGPWDTDEIYKVMCAEVIQKNIPLGVN